jgi:hypothetical protein
MVAMNASRSPPVIVATLLELIAGYTGTALCRRNGISRKSAPGSHTTRAGDFIMLLHGEHIHRWYDEERVFRRAPKPEDSSDTFLRELVAIVVELRGSRVVKAAAEPTQTPRFSAG